MGAKTVVRQVVARPGGGAFADVRYYGAGGAGGAAVADTLENAANQVVYTFSQALPVAALKFANTP